MSEAAAGGLIVSIATALRAERERAGLSLTELARRAGIAKSTLSQLEAANGNPSVETLWALATALDIPFTRLIDPPRPRVRVVRAGDGPVVRARRSDYAATLLAACPPRARRDLYRIEVQPGRARLSDPHPPGTVEHLILTSGRALAGPAGDPATLEPGDYMTYPGDEPHTFEALAPDTTAVMLVEHS